MNIDEISLAIPDSWFDFILCDACYMGAVEVAYDLREDCRYYVASPAAVMGGGFPYEDMVEHLFSCDKPIPENLIDVCRSYMDYYRSYYDPYGTVSLIDMHEMEALAHSVRLALVSCVDSLEISDVQQFSQEKGTRLSYQNLFFDLNELCQSGLYRYHWHIPYLPIVSTVPCYMPMPPIVIFLRCRVCGKVSYRIILRLCRLYTRSQFR